MDNKFNLPSYKKQKLYDNLNNYENKFKDNKNNDSNLNIESNLNLFNRNLNILPFGYKLNIVKSTISNNQINKLILLNELENLNIEINKDENKMIKYIFDRYTYKASGYLFKSNNWELRAKDEDYFIYQNIINSDYLYDSNTKEYLNLMFNFFVRNLKNYNVYVDKYFIDRDKIYYIFFIFMKRSDGG